MCVLFKTLYHRFARWAAEITQIHQLQLSSSHPPPSSGLCLAQLRHSLKRFLSFPPPNTVSHLASLFDHLTKDLTYRPYDFTYRVEISANFRRRSVKLTGDPTCVIQNSCDLMWLMGLRDEHLFDSASNLGAAFNPPTFGLRVLEAVSMDGAIEEKGVWYVMDELASPIHAGAAVFPSQEHLVCAKWQGCATTRFVELSFALHHEGLWFHWNFGNDWTIPTMNKQITDAFNSWKFPGSLPAELAELLRLSVGKQVWMRAEMNGDHPISFQLDFTLASIECVMVALSVSRCCLTFFFFFNLVIFVS